MQNTAAVLIGTSEETILKNFVIFKSSTKSTMIKTLKIFKRQCLQNYERTQDDSNNLTGILNNWEFSGLVVIPKFNGTEANILIFRSDVYPRIDHNRRRIYCH